MGLRVTYADYWDDCTSTDLTPIAPSLQCPITNTSLKNRPDKVGFRLGDFTFPSLYITVLYVFAQRWYDKVWILFIFFHLFLGI